VPALVNYSEFETASALVLERIEGVTFLGLHMDDDLSLAHLVQALKILDEFHSHGYLVGDAKLANFIFSQTQEIKAIDFESAVSIVEAKSLPKYASFLFTDPQLVAHPCAWEKLHFLYSVIHLVDERSDSVKANSANRVVCLQKVLESNVTLPPIAAEARRLARDLFSAVH
jgi:serine/threonine protein kinase